MENIIYMEKTYPGEQWKPIVFDFDFENTTSIEISNYGRLRTFNKISNGNIIKGSMVNGYQIIRLKFFKPRDEAIQSRLHFLKQQVAQLTKKTIHLKLALKDLDINSDTYRKCQTEYEETVLLLKDLKERVSNKFNEDLKDRTVYFQALIHRLVAQYFLKQPSPAHTVVAHIDYDKLNNNKNNLRWMTPEDNYLHQRFSPNVMASKTYENGRRKEDARSTKLSVTKVMLLKKLLNEGKPMRQLVKQFRVTETQILRIKRGENWAEVQAAP
ncbi:MAG: numod4 domain protein [Ferruginibacter sp.]|nr:numod4 domain protein [Ferruginibacter sp.]